MTNVAEQRTEPWFRRLLLPSYQVVEAARYSRTHPNTVARWHYGENPVLPGHERKRPLSYMELVEVAFVAFFRRMGVGMPRIRAARAYLATTFTSEYPFVEYRFLTEGFHVLMDYKEYEDPRSDFDKLIMADSDGQLAWAEMLGDKFAEFDYEQELALKWHPRGRHSKVVIDPRISFGAPIVEGLPTWVIKGRWQAQEEIAEITDEFGVSREAVIEGLRFEGIDVANGKDNF